MIGMNIFVVDILFGVRMFWLGSLEFGSFRASFVGLTAFVLDPHFYARLKRFLGRPTWPVRMTS